MAKQTINIGTSANDGTGSTLRAAFDITNDNFTELYDGTGGLLHKIEGTNFTGSLLIGHSTTGTLSSAENNTGVGINSLKSLTSGDANIGLGARSGFNLTSGSGNILIGNRTGENIINGDYNVAIGDEALFTEDGHGKNVAIGYHALRAQDAGADAFNVAIGHQAGKDISTGVQNTIIGGLAGDSLNSGEFNTVVGYRTLTVAGTGSRNTAMGWSSLRSVTGSGSRYNTAFGFSSGENISSGIQNTIIGGLAGDGLTTGSNNTIIGYGSAASAVDVSNEVTIGNSSVANVRIPSDSTLKIGADGDLQIEHVSSNSFIKNTAVGDLYIENQVDDASIIFRCDDGSGGLDTYFSVVGAGNRVQYNKDLRLIDNIELSLGSSDDLKIYHNATNSEVVNATGNLNIKNSATNGDISFFADDGGGSGGTTTYFKLDGSARDVVFSKDIYLNDDVRVRAGTGGDFSFFHNGSNSKINNNTGNIEIENFQDDGDIIFKTDDGSGGTTEYFRVDGGEGRLVHSVNSRYLDSVVAMFGAGGDMLVYHSGSTGYIENHTGHFQLIQQVDDGDIIFKSDDGSGGTTEYFRVDGGNEHVVYSKPVIISDSVSLKFGDANDLSIQHNQGASLNQIDNNNFDLYIQQNAADKDIIFRSDDGSGGLATYLTIDGGTVTNIFSQHTNFIDSKKALFGTGSDLEIYHNGTDSKIENTNGDLQISNYADDKDIIFKSDDGGGSLAEYFKLDGSEVRCLFSVNAEFSDNVKAKFGSSDDLQIYHDGSNSYISDTGTGSLYITGSNLIIQSSTNKNAIIANDSDSVDLYYNASKKFETTNSGATVTGALSITGDGSNAATFTESGSGDFTIATVDDLRLDSGGNDIVLRGASSAEFGRLSNDSNNFIIKNITADKDIIFQADDGSGGTTEYFRLDGGEVQTKFLKAVQFEDNVQLRVGASNDLQILHDASDSFLINNTGDLYIRNLADDKDIIFQSDDGSGGTATYFTIDGSGTRTLFSKNIRLEDDVQLNIGSSDDFRLVHSPDNSFIQNFTGDLQISNFADDKDILFRCDDGSGGLETYFFVDGGENRVTSNKEFRFIDSAKAIFGTGGDLQIYHDGTDSQIKNATGDLKIEVGADDKDIVFRGDDGSGAITTYVQLDGSEVSTKILTQKVIMSNLPTSDPSNAGQLYNDSGVLKVSAG